MNELMQSNLQVKNLENSQEKLTNEQSNFEKKFFETELEAQQS